MFIARRWSRLSAELASDQSFSGYAELQTAPLCSKLLNGNCLRIEREDRVTRFELFQGLQDSLDDGKVSRPFVISGYHMPGRVLRLAAIDRILVGLLIVVPERTFLKIS